MKEKENLAKSPDLSVEDQERDFVLHAQQHNNQ